MVDINMDLLEAIYNFSDKKAASLVDKSTSCGTVKHKIISNRELAKE